MNRLKQMSRDLRTGQKVDSRLVEAMEICAELSIGAVCLKILLALLPNPF